MGNDYFTCAIARNSSARTAYFIDDRTHRLIQRHWFGTETSPTDKIVGEISYKPKMCQLTDSRSTANLSNCNANNQPKITDDNACYYNFVANDNYPPDQEHAYLFHKLGFYYLDMKNQKLNFQETRYQNDHMERINAPIQVGDIDNNCYRYIKDTP